MDSKKTGTASEFFGGMSDAYDSLIRRAVPRYAEMTARLVDYLPPRAERVLELGSGTGNLTLELARRYPKASLTIVDAAPEMIAVARSRLEALDPSAVARATFVTSRFEDLSLAPASFDLAASCISLHHVEEKGALFRALHAALVPKGALRFADQIRGGSESIHDLNWTRWLEYCRAPGGCTEDEVTSLLEHAAAHDHYTPLAEQFRLLETSGFTAIDCVWRNWIWGIVTAEKR